MQQDYHTIRHNKYFAWLMMPDYAVRTSHPITSHHITSHHITSHHTPQVGCLALLVASCTLLARTQLSKRINADMSAPKRIQVGKFIARRHNFTAAGAVGGCGRRVAGAGCTFTAPLCIWCAIATSIVRHSHRHRCCRGGVVVAVDSGACLWSLAV